MKIIMLTLLVGLVAGLFDCLPMIKMKMDKHSILSAFTFYFIMPFIIFNLNLPIIPWWIKGGLIALLLALPVMIIVVKEDKKAIVPMIINAIVIGTLISVAGQIIR